MPFQITYGTGRVAGFVGSDTVTLGSNPAVQVQRQGFGGVFDSSMDFLSASCDGLFVSPSCYFCFL
jgi:Eukaryotic aspartyl protease